MELVYLWVKEYKNIKNQGFNFSPRFTCNYENGELTITENDHHSIFPPNINVTAIVGENGSGKSTILEKLYFRENIVITFFGNQITIYSKIDFNIINNTSYNFIKELENKKLKLSYINISHFHSEDIDIHDNDFISIYRDLMYPFDEDDVAKNDSAILKRYKNFKTQLYYLFIYQNEIFASIEKTLEIPKIYYIAIDFLKDNRTSDFFKNNQSIKINQLLCIILSDKYTDSFENDNSKLDKKLLNTFLKSYSSKDLQIIDGLLKNSVFIDNKLVIDIKYIELMKKFIDIIVDKEKLESFELSLLSQKKERIDLSSGQQIMFFYITFIFKSAEPLLIIDEVDMYLHPYWQKKFILLLTNSLKEQKKNCHIILTSHSPFILSDIPKENVIFLEKGKQVYPNIETFGANIHTLLSHGFFMKDGLMGEFAKNKINEVIDYLNGKNSPIADDDEAQRYIRIIGEPIVKRQLQRMLDSKKLDKIKDIDALKNQIESLQNRLENLEKRS